MPVIRYYEVEQIRTVHVKANSLADAAKIATLAFENGQNSDFGYNLENLDAADLDALQNVWGNTVDAVREISLQVTEKN